MFRSKTARLALPVFVIAVAAFQAAYASAVILDLRSDPEDTSSSGPVLFIEGPGASAVDYTGGTPAAFSSDRRGSLLATYDGAHAATRAEVDLGGFYTQDDDFVFGAVLMLDSATFHADPFGFHPISLSLINQVTTGFDRSGDPGDFRADTFDTVEIAYFPQVSPLFGGPFLSPSVFGEQVSDDAFANFAFGSSETAIPFDVPVGIIAEHVASNETLVVTLYMMDGTGVPVEIQGSRTVAQLSSISGFAVNALAITACQDGFNAFSPSGLSLHAETSYERLLFAPGRLGTNGSGLSLSTLLRVAGEGARGFTAR